MPLNRRTPPPQAETPMRDSGHHAFSLGRIAAITDRKSTRLNSSHEWISYAVFCLKKKKISGEGGAAVGSVGLQEEANGAAGGVAGEGGRDVRGDDVGDDSAAVAIADLTRDAAGTV